MTRRGAVLAAIAAVISCTHVTPQTRDDEAAEQSRYRAGEGFCSNGDNDACLELVATDLHDFRLRGGPHHGDVVRLHRARGRLVRLCGDSEEGLACMRVERNQPVRFCAAPDVGRACMTIYREYATIFEGHPGPAPRETYVWMACAYGFEKACPLIAGTGTPP